ncbi:adaptor protein MecA [Lederbergia lenta]|uniref:Adapter protein MecA n=1 Tax=Lederbergia lenta TaxID=1467 RepID=A0A2X4WQC7_LEDLE|nr:adaptor protein MecA [Lederbergia lenta]MCM3110452.1 adaptor protein MecA [Lederbergia lenta]MEC2323982.1 adaptor protein MecA [Lederbergia lenta]SQI60872.1 Negative regulator of genetic competence [Lederbergia lenta]
MEIERINENTIKFYISYIDIEERGFDREEIWYNRERGEELFWEMLDEVHQEDEFVPEGPLWIQIQALDKGLEILVTKAQISKDGNKLELPIPEDKLKDLPIDAKMEEFLDQQFQIKSYDTTVDQFEFILAFKEFEDILELAKTQQLENVETKLYHYESKYYVYLHFPEELYDEDKIEDALSLPLEYGFESNFTIHRLKEYGKEIIDENVFSTIEQYFN